jgi:hypothetical protein
MKIATVAEPEDRNVRDSIKKKSEDRMSLNAARAKEALARLETRQPGVFGATCHHFRLNPPLGEGEVAEFENPEGIRLLRDYRSAVGPGPNKKRTRNRARF